MFITLSKWLPFNLIYTIYQIIRKHFFRIFSFIFVYFTAFQFVTLLLFFLYSLRIIHTSFEWWVFTEFWVITSLQNLCCFHCMRIFQVSLNSRFFTLVRGTPSLLRFPRLFKVVQLIAIAWLSGWFMCFLWSPNLFSRQFLIIPRVLTITGYDVTFTFHRCLALRQHQGTYHLFTVFNFNSITGNWKWTILPCGRFYHFTQTKWKSTKT